MEPEFHYRLRDSSPLLHTLIEVNTAYIPILFCKININIVYKFDMWLTVHRSSMWNKKPTRCHLVLCLFLLYKLLNMFRATFCPSSGGDDLVVFLPRVV